MRRRRRKMNRWQGIVLGMVGSLAGLLAMELYWNKVAPQLSRGEGESDSDDQASKPEPLDDISLVGRQYEDGESSTAAIGRLTYQKLTGQAPRSKEGRTLLSYLVHWLYGILQGGVYGGLRASGQGVDLLGGSVFGLALWFFGDELLVPLLGFQSGPTDAPPAQHLNRMGAHLSYGVVTAAVTQLLKRMT